MPRPQWDPILSFLHVFLLKSTCIAPKQPTQQCWHPPLNGKSWIPHCIRWDMTYTAISANTGSTAHWFYDIVKGLSKMFAT